jgi:hypothetical protein
MKIEGSARVGPGASRRAASAAPGFALAAEASSPARSAAGVTNVTPLDAILALQGDDSPSRRRRQQVLRGQQALDALERLELGIVRGRAPGSLGAELQALGRASEATGDAQLDAVLLEIDIRLAVESAKLERLAGAAPPLRWGPKDVT